MKKVNRRVMSLLDLTEERLFGTVAVPVTTGVSFAVDAVVWEQLRRATMNEIFDRAHEEVRYR